MSSIVCNVVDSSGNPVDCNYFGYHYETGNVSETRFTENQQISFDTEDADWDGQGVSVPEGDILLIVAYTDTECSVSKIVSTGSNLYVYDVQVLVPQVPRITIYTDKDIYITGETVEASSSVSDEYLWEYNNTTFYHKDTWYNLNVCSLIGIDKVEYDFGEGFIESNSHIFTTASSYYVIAKVTNKAGLEAEDVKYITVNNSKPSVSIGIENKEYFYLDSVYPIVTIDDPDDIIVRIDYYINNIKVNDLNYSINSLGNIEFKAYVTYDNGFTSSTFTVTSYIEVTNKPPVLTANYEMASNAEVDINISIYDFEGLPDKAVCKVYIKGSSVIEDAIEDIYVKEFSIYESKRLTFVSEGTYVLKLIGYDQQGLGSNEVVLDDIVITKEAVVEMQKVLIPYCANSETIGDIESHDVNAAILDIVQDDVVEMEIVDATDIEVDIDTDKEVSEATADTDDTQ